MKFNKCYSSDSFSEKPKIINLKDLDELIKLIEKEGTIIMDIEENEHPTIEIYDDYRE